MARLGIIATILLVAGSSYADDCCVGRVGDANGEGIYPDEVTLGDIMLMVDAKFISGDCSKLPCLAEADVNQDGGADPTCEDNVTLGDIMALVDFLFITGPENATLPVCFGSELQFQSISSTSGEPGTIITIYGVESPDPIEELVVIFDTISMSAYSRTDTSVMFACPALPAGSYQVSMDHPLAPQKQVADYQVLEPQPTGLPPGEVAEELVTSISTINQSVVACVEVLETNGMISAEGMDSLQTTMSRLDAILANAVDMIRDLPDAEREILDQRLVASGLSDLFGSSGLLKGLPSNTVELRSFLDDQSDYSAFNACVLGDNISFGLSAVKAALTVVNIASVVATLGLSVPANAALTVITFEIASLDNLFDGFLPTDLYHVELRVIPPNGTPFRVGETAALEYWGYFRTQSGPATAILDTFIRGIFWFLPAEPIDKLIADIVRGIGIGAVEDILGNQQVVTLTVPLQIDISYYQQSGEQVLQYTTNALSGVLPGIQLSKALSTAGYSFLLMALQPLTIYSNLVAVSDDLVTVTALQQGVIEPSQIDMKIWVIDPACESDGGWWWTWICLGIELPEMLESNAFSKPQIVIDDAADPNTVTDIDGNVYQTVTIGTQVWMAENLKVTRYRNNDAIPEITSSSTWSSLTTGAYCEYNNNESNVATYGRLYNWYAVNDSRNIAPEGWHVPTDAEWKQLEMYLGLSQAQADAMNWRGTTEGGKLKEAEFTHWSSPNTGATNAWGFTALPGGLRVDDGSYIHMGDYTSFWSASAAAYSRDLIYNSAQVSRSWHAKPHGFSVRCVKN